MKKQSCIWGGDGNPPYSRAISPLVGWDSQSSIQHLDTATLGDASQIPCPTLKHDPRELEVSSAAMETSQIKDKLKKRRMSEGLLAPPKGKTSHLSAISDDMKPLHVTDKC